MRDLLCQCLKGRYPPAKVDGDRRNDFNLSVHRQSKWLGWDCSAVGTQRSESNGVVSIYGL